MAEETIEVDIDEFKASLGKLRPRGDVPINEYTLEGDYVTTYTNHKEASHVLKVPLKWINCCLTGQDMHLRNRDSILLYADDSISDRLDKLSRKRTAQTILIREYLFSGELLKVWQNKDAVVKAFGITLVMLNKVLKGKVLWVKDRIFLTGAETIRDRIVLIELEKQRLREAEEKQQIINSFKAEAKKVNAIRVYTSSGEFLRECGSVREAHNIYGIKSSSIGDSLYGRALVTHGLVFIYANDSIEERLRKIKNRRTHKKNL